MDEGEWSESRPKERQKSLLQNHQFQVHSFIFLPILCHEFSEFTPEEEE